MKIIKKGLTKCYIIHETNTGQHMICRVLNEYSDENEAEDVFGKYKSEQCGT